MLDKFASSSSSSSSSLPTTAPPRRAPSDVFRPRLPLDPFTPAPSQLPAAPAVDPDAPWPVRDLLALTASFAAAPHVLLVLGAPSPHALLPLLRSPTFAQSLVLLVTHAPPPRAALPAHIHPASASCASPRPSPPPPPPSPSTSSPSSTPPPSSRVPGAPPRPRRPPARAGRGRRVRRPRAARRRRPAAVRAPPPRPRTRPAPLPALRPGSVPLRVRPPALDPLAPPLPPREHPLHRLRLLPAPQKEQAKASQEGPARPRARVRRAAQLSPPAQPERAVLKQVVLVSTLAGAFLAGPAAAAAARAPAPSHSHSRASSFGRASRPGTPERPSAGGADWSSAPSTPYTYSHSGGSASGAPSLASLSRPPSPALSTRSFFGRAAPPAPAFDLAPAPAPRGAGRAHIVHVLPATYRAGKLTGALGAFLASYAPASAHAHAYSQRGPKAYVLAERALRDVERGRGRGAWVAGVLVGEGEGEGGGESPPDTDSPLARDAEREGREGKAGEETHPYGLPTPPASRSGSDEGPGAAPSLSRLATSASTSNSTSSAGSQALARTPSQALARTPSTTHAHAHAHARTPSQAARTLSTAPPSPTLLRTPSTSPALPPGAAPPAPAKLRRAPRGSVSSAHYAPPSAFASAPGLTDAVRTEKETPGTLKKKDAPPALAPVRRRVESAPVERASPPSAYLAPNADADANADPHPPSAYLDPNASSSATLGAGGGSRRSRLFGLGGRGGRGGGGARRICGRRGGAVLARATQMGTGRGGSGSGGGCFGGEAARSVWVPG
ncbi:hypothetical protein B0H17DRAFT_1331787 [Mycena rosella]|uniref:Uncharacterized protein n=1 Tax=Mycena rosella TaxID=1033263 RepID=A0AAD7GIG4_MYCRO|nr:hypothetical protein B0H17DRAFT_1331787 [Mycena rosella]